MIFALIPAAGHSRRMGRPKLALRIGGKPVLQHVVEGFRRAGIEHILVVLAPHVADLRSLAESAGAQVLLLAEPTPDMQATVQWGLHWLEDQFHPTADDRWLLVPADHPTLDHEVVLKLMEARNAHPERSIVIPTFEGRRGHPALIDWKHAEAIRQLPAGTGINVYLRKHEAETLELPVETAEVLVDLDTPEDYERQCLEKEDYMFTICGLAMVFFGIGGGLVGFFATSDLHWLLLGVLVVIVPAGILLGIMAIIVGLLRAARNLRQRQ